MFCVDSCLEAICHDSLIGERLVDHNVPRRWVATLALVTMMSATNPARADLVASGSIQELVAKADVIVVGKVVDVRHTQATGSGFVLIVPDRTLKGPSLDGPLRLHYEGALVVNETLFQGQQALAFAATDSDSGLLRLLPMVSARTPTLDDHLLVSDSAARRTLIAANTNDTPIQKVIKELATIQAYSESPKAASYLLEMAWQRAEAEVMRAAFRAMRESATTNGFVHGTTGLVALGNLEGLEALDEALLDGREEIRGIVGLLAQTYRSTDPKGVVILARWLAEGSIDMRVAAAGALARVHTAEAAEALGPALSHPDSQVQRRAVTGLSMFANHVQFGSSTPATGDWPFRTVDTIRYSAYTEEAVVENPEYIDFWRTWWSVNSTIIREFGIPQKVPNNPPSDHD